jgi:DNA polymerase elongation subunit (family B)
MKATSVSKIKPKTSKLNASVSFRLYDFNAYDKMVLETDIDDDPESESDAACKSGSGSSVTSSSSSSSASSAESHKKSKFDNTKLKPKTNRVFHIQMFGMNELGKTCAITVTDYKPFFYAKLGEVRYPADLTRRFVAHLKSLVPDLEERECDLVNHKKLYMFDAGKKHQFIKLVFKNLAAMKKARMLWYIVPAPIPPTLAASAASGQAQQDKNKAADKMQERIRTDARLNPRGLQFQGCTLNIYESNLPPLLRYFHIREISPSGWVSFPIRKATRITISDLKQTTCDFEFTVCKDDLVALNTKEKSVPYKICSFDIEASSSHGDFPIPVKTCKKLAANIVDACISSLSMGSTITRDFLERLICIAYGQTEPLPSSAAECKIERIYPKTRYADGRPVKCKLADLRRMCSEWLDTPIDEILSSKSADQTQAKTQRIEQMFERMKARNDQDVDQDLGVDVDQDEVEEVEAEEVAAEDVEVDDVEDDDVEVEADDVKVMLPIKARATSSTSSSIKILDILHNPAMDRETKIGHVSNTLNAIFPPVEGDIVTFIGSTFVRHGEKAPYCNHCIVLDTCDVARIANEVPNLVIECYKTEREVLLAWTRLIQRENPDIVVGYNIFGFDYEFMFRRALETRCEQKFLQLSRNKGEVCGKRDFKTGEFGIEETSIVIASGQHDLHFIKMPGRLQIDLYNYFRRDYNLSSYKLDFVSGYFIGDDVKRIEHLVEHRAGTAIDASGEESAEITKIYSANLSGLESGNYIVFEETNNSTDAYKDGAKFKVCECNGGEGWFTIEGREELNMSKHVRWGLAKDDVTPQDIFRMTREGPASRAIIAKYCIQDCNLVHHLLNKIDVLTGFIEMSKICSVPMSFLVMRGQGIKLTSYIAKKCRERDTLIPDLDKSGSNEGYEGAIVLPPKCGLYLDNPVVCVDYSSLYPSCIISESLSHDSKVWTKEYDLSGRLVRETGEKGIGETGEKDKGRAYTYKYDNLPNYDYVDITYDTYRWTRNARGKSEKSVSGTKVCRFAQFKDGTKPILPSILEELLAARKATRKQAEAQDDPFMANILDKRQLGYKVTANSLYGQCGAKTSTMYDVDVAAATTATGRKLLTYARRIVEEVYGDTQVQVRKSSAPSTGNGEIGMETVHSRAEYVYGDTDSVFFTFNLHTMDGTPIVGRRALEMSIELGQQVGELASRYLKAPHAWTYEKTMMPFFLLRKKGYIGMLYEKNPNKGKRKSMGIVLKRRDNAPIVKDIYGGAIDILMNEQNVDTAIEYVRRSIRELVEERCPLDKLVITKSLRSTYKNPLQIAHKVLADRMGMRDPGNKPGSGDRIPFVYIHNETKGALQGERIETPDHIIKHRIKPDYAFYITNQIMKPVQQVFALGLEKMTAFKRRRGNYEDAVETLRSHFASDAVKLDKKITDLRNKEVKEIIFEEYLRICENMKKRNQSITKFFGQVNK